MKWKCTGNASLHLIVNILRNKMNKFYQKYLFIRFKRLIFVKGRNCLILFISKKKFLRNKMMKKNVLFNPRLMKLVKCLLRNKEEIIFRTQIKHKILNCTMILKTGSKNKSRVKK